MKPLAALANTAWFASSLAAKRRYENGLRRPEDAQRQRLRRLLVQNSLSAYGKAYSFGKIRSYEEFRKRVPLTEYEDLEPWIERTRRGERGVLTCDPVTHLMPTSGSSGCKKLIPFTAGYQTELSAAIGPWIADLFAQHPNILLGPAYWSISPNIQSDNDEPESVPIGFADDTVYLGSIRARLAGATLAAPSQLGFVRDIDTFRYLTILCLIREPDLRLISVWHPSFLTLLLEALPAWWNELLEDVRAGGCQRAGGLAQEVLRAVAARPNPRRFAQLQSIDPTHPCAIWPHLKVVSCWTHSHAHMAAEHLQRLLPGVHIQAKGLLATEAFVSIPYRGFHPLAITSHFFEFIDEKGEIFLAHQLQEEGRYQVVVTTAAGLWRYRLGDWVEVNAFVEKTPSVRFIGRGQTISDICGEKLSDLFVAEAIRKASAETSFSPHFAMLAPEEDAQHHWHYTIFLQGEVPPDFLARLDTHLRQNPHYNLCRNLSQLGPPECCLVDDDAEGVFSHVLASCRQKLGDIKPQGLSKNTDWRRHFTTPASKPRSAANTMVD